MLKPWACGLAGLLLAGCNGSEPADVPAVEARAGSSGLDKVPDSGFCDRLASAEWTVEPTCTGCTVADAAAAADGSDQTFATVTFTAGGLRTGGAALRAFAPPGTVYEAGRTVSAFLREPNEMSNYTLSLRTYLAGVPQQDTTLTGGTGTRTDNEEVTSLRTTLPFDAIEYYIKVGTSQGTAVGEVVELCLDGN